VVQIHQPEGVRLQKVLAAAGIGSRRACEELIEAGAVRVDGQIVREQGIRVIPGAVTIEVKGKRIAVDDTRVTVALNKPKGVVSTMSDPEGRPSLDQYVKEFDERLFHVGRLDADTTGLLLLTNDGELANRLAHPTHGVEKVYVAKVAGRVPKGLGATLKAGVELDDGPVRVAECVIRDATDKFSLVEVTLHEGRNRIVRRMFEAVGFPVSELVRIQFGPVVLGQLAPGKIRVLDNEEVGSLMKAAGL
jgi:23S rRNA pseudouridine2605 synthase